MTDEIRERLARIDPLRDVSIDPVDSDRARALLEAVMSTPLVSSPRRWPALAGVVGLAAAAVIAVAVVRSGDDAPSAPPLALSLSETDPAMSMCLPIDATMVATADLAFSGTVADIADGTVTLDVDRWYRGGDAARVTISTPEGFIAALDGVDFVTGDRYLVSSTGGVVGGCGASGPASPELEQLFIDAFGA